MKITQDQIRENRIRLIASLVADYLAHQELRVYTKLVNGKFPPGYAVTFKIIKTRPRRKRK